MLPLTNFNNPVPTLKDSNSQTLTALERLQQPDLVPRFLTGRTVSRPHPKEKKLTPIPEFASRSGHTIPSIPGHPENLCPQETLYNPCLLLRSLMLLSQAEATTTLAFSSQYISCVKSVVHCDFVSFFGSQLLDAFLLELNTAIMNFRVKIIY